MKDEVKEMKYRPYPQEPPTDFVKVLGIRRLSLVPFLKQQQNSQKIHWAHNGIDIIVVCQDGWIPVHRSVLASRCKDFDSSQEFELNNNSSAPLEYLMMLEYKVSHALAVFNLLYTGMMAFRFSECDLMQRLLQHFGLLEDTPLVFAPCEFIDEEDFRRCQNLAFYTGKVDYPKFGEGIQEVVAPVPRCEDPVNSHSSFKSAFAPIRRPRIIITRRINHHDRVIIRFRALAY